MSASPGRIPHEWCARGLREPPGSDAQITLDLIRDIAVDREQAGLIKLRLSNVRSRFLTVVVTERQFQALRLLRRAVVRREVTVYTGEGRRWRIGGSVDCATPPVDSTTGVASH